MRRRRSAIPRLEAMEDRMVPSAINIPLAGTTQAQIRRLDRNVKHAAGRFQQDLTTFIQNRMGQAHHTQWPTHHAKSHHTHNLFGIPFLNF
jgi:hypothetical protein